MADETGVRFAEAIDFLRRRLALPSGRWSELLREVDSAATERGRGMTDALMKDVLRATLKAVEDGTTFDAFLDDYADAVRRHGWTADEAEIPHRAALAFRLLTAQAYAAGRWQQVQRLKHVRPYLRYVHVDPTLTQPGSRHEHADWHGVILPVDHEWWLTHYPPNGWNCRCTVQTLSAREIDRRGWSVSDEAPPARTVIRFLRGEPMETPAGIDPGFAVNWGVAGVKNWRAA